MNKVTMDTRSIRWLADYTKIVEANSVSNPDRIQVGQQRKIPAAEE